MFVQSFYVLIIVWLCTTAPAIANTPADTLGDAAAAFTAGDFAKARQLWLPLAEQGVAEAQYRLGILHELGLGLPKRDTEAASWYGMAVANNHLDAKAKLGQWYREGKGVRKNATRAVLLLYSAAMEGHKDAMQTLVSMAETTAQGRKSAKAVLFGQDLTTTRRGVLRETLGRTQSVVVRQDDAYICDVYDVRKAIPGATEMAACYGNTGVPVAEQALGFIKIDYDAPDKAHADKIKVMVTGRFGPPSAGEGTDAALWNLGKVLAATQYAPDLHRVGLMYMIPEVYHMTQIQQEPVK